VSSLAVFFRFWITSFDTAIDVEVVRPTLTRLGPSWSTRAWLLLVALAGVPLGLLMAAPSAAFAQEGPDEPATRVDTEAELRTAWADLTETHIELTADIFLHQCKTGDPIRESPYPMLLDGKGHTIRQTCFEKRVLRQDGTGFLVLKNVKLTRGGSDGPGAAVTTRGEIKVVDSKVQQNLAEEPGGGIFSMRRATIIRSVVTNNLANDDGGGVYARRGGVQVFDSTISNNLVDGSGGAIGSTGDILLVRSHSDGNTTDGDGGALYADEDGDVTVVDSTVDGSDADGPGGGIWTLEGDVTVVGSTLNGNRADDRGGAIGGEADVFVINSTVARNESVAHVAGGIFSRGNLYIANSTISNNYAEGQGGGILGGGMVRLEHSSILNNTAPVAANVGAGEGLESYASVIGPAKITDIGGQVQPTERNCHLGGGSGSFGYNLATDASCGLDGPDDIVDEDDPLLGPLGDNGGFGETLLPESGSPVIDRMPTDACDLLPFENFLKEGDQHLEGLVDDRPALMLKDQRGVDRPQGQACEVGAVELGP
jgi:predicted outer membrane repeat protein